jgi:hypothetical protein
MSRWRLHKTKLQEFKAFCESIGWYPVPTKSDFEVLRMRNVDVRDPLIVHTRLNVKEHLTTHGESEKLLDVFLGHKPEVDDRYLKPTAEHASDDLPW